MSYLHYLANDKPQGWGRGALNKGDLDRNHKRDDLSGAGRDLKGGSAALAGRGSWRARRASLRGGLRLRRIRLVGLAGRGVGLISGRGSGGS